MAACVFASPAGAYVNAEHAGVQVALRALGLYHGPIDGVVGPKTVAAIKVAQRRAHLPVTGLADKRTRLSLGPLGRPLLGQRVLRPRTFGFDVAVLQFLLTRRGVYDGPLDGYLSGGTAAALRRYQRQVHLAPDGVARPPTPAPPVPEPTAPARPPPAVTLGRAHVVRPGGSVRVT